MQKSPDVVYSYKSSGHGSIKGQKNQNLYQNH